MTANNHRPMRAKGPTKATINRALDMLAEDFEAIGARATVNHLPVCPDCAGEGHTDGHYCARCDGQG